MSTTCPDTARLASQPRAPAPGRGFSMLSVLFILVALAALGAALSTVSTRQHLDSALDLDSARALQSARAGLEWAAWQVLRNPAPPAAAPGCFGTTSFSPGGTLAGFVVTVGCSRTPGSGTVSDGERELAFFVLTATACNQPSGGACPAPGMPQATYVERQLSWTVAR